MVDAQYTLGGVPTILIPSDMLNGSGLCGNELQTTADNGGKAAALNAANSLSPLPTTLPLILIGLLYVLLAI